MAPIKQRVQTMVAILCVIKYRHPTKLASGPKQMGISIDFIINKKNKRPKDIKYNSIFVFIIERFL